MDEKRVVVVGSGHTLSAEELSRLVGEGTVVFGSPIAGAPCVEVSPPKPELPVEYSPGEWNKPVNRTMQTPICPVCKRRMGEGGTFRKFGDNYYCALHYPDERFLKISRKERRKAGLR